MTASGAVTERPWRADRDDNGFYLIVAQGPYPSPYIVATGGEGETDEANAAFIIRACNAFDEMKAALEEVEWIDDPDTGEKFCPCCEYIQDNGHAKDCALASVLALATGATP